MKKSLIILIAVVFIMQLSKNVVAEVHGSLGLGLNYNFGYDLDELNSNFNDNSIGTVDESIVLPNLCFHMFNDKNKFIWGLDLNFQTKLIKKSSKGTSYTSQFKTTSFTADVGYHLVQTKVLSLFPLLGLGFRENEISIYQNDFENNWNNFTSGNISSSTIINNKIIMKLSLRTELLIPNLIDRK